MERVLRPTKPENLKLLAILALAARELGTGTKWSPSSERGFKTAAKSNGWVELRGRSLVLTSEVYYASAIQSAKHYIQLYPAKETLPSNKQRGIFPYGQH